MLDRNPFCFVQYLPPVVLAGCFCGQHPQSVGRETDITVMVLGEKQEVGFPSGFGICSVGKLLVLLQPLLEEDFAGVQFKLPAGAPVFLPGRCLK